MVITKVPLACMSARLHRARGRVLKERDSRANVRSVRPRAGAARGIIGVPRDVEHDRYLPTSSLAPWIAHFWSVRWALREPETAVTLPHPTTHLVFEAGELRIVPPSTGRFARELRGRGSVFGIKFRPATYGAALDGVEVVDLAVALGADEDAEARVAIAESWLATRVRPLPAEVTELRDLVERMEVDRALLRAEDAAEALGVDLRTLQRRFRRSVGCTPKWVIQRYRLHEAAERLRAGEAPSAIAAALGYADQAHFTRDFRRVVGVAPSALRTKTDV
jgi:AraC-like DNA-binding protein